MLSSIAEPRGNACPGLQSFNVREHTSELSNSGEPTRTLLVRPAG